MTVKQLREALEHCPDDAEVIISDVHHVCRRVDSASWWPAVSARLGVRSAGPAKAVIDVDGEFELE